MKDLKIEPNTDRLILPKDLVKSHDDYVKVLNLIRQEELAKRRAKEAEEKIKKLTADEKAYKKRLKQIRKLEAEFDGYVFKVPTKLEDIIEEGIVLSHCVGGSDYLEGHKKGSTTIIFVRTKEAPETPLCTMEFKDNRIVQLQGYDNKTNNVPESAKAAAEHWLEWSKTLNLKKKVS